MAHIMLLIIISVIGIAESAKEPNLEPTNLKGRIQGKKCTTNGGTVGICADWSYCHQGVLQPGGVIDSSELRSASECGAMHWCCEIRNITKPPEVTKKEECFASDGDFCPWCVSLYRGSTKEAAELFCAGVLIGSNIVLTSATCVVVSHNQNVWAKIPDASSMKMYAVTKRKMHDDYSSGSREYDLGLFNLDEEVEWTERRKEACLSLASPFKSACFSFGYNAKDQFVSTLLEITQGSCTPGAGEADDVYCGRPIDDEECLVATGAPVICEEAVNKMTVYGIARSPCSKSAAQLGAIYMSSKWLENELKGFGLSESHYLLKRYK